MATSNLSYIVTTIGSPDFEGNKNQVYVPKGCFVTLGTKRVTLTDLQAENSKLKTPLFKKVSGSNMEAVCVSDPLRTWQQIGHSGFTVGAGFDISQHSVSDIKALHFAPDIEKELLPYAKGSTKIPETKTIFTDAQINQINNKVVNNMLAALAAKYNGQNPPVKFNDLNVQNQFVLYSLYHQCVNHLFSPKYPVNNVWKRAIVNDWAGVKEELLKIKDINYIKRRKAEAALIVIPTGTPTPTANTSASFRQT